MRIHAIRLFLIVLYALPATAQDNPMRISIEQGLYPLADTGMIQALIRRGHTLRYSAPDSGKQLYEDALYRSRQGGYMDGIAAALLGLSGFYADKGELSKSAALLRSALPYGEASSDPDEYIVALNNALGVVYTHFGMFDTAALHYYRALKEFEQRQMTDTPLLLQLHTNLGGAWVTNMQYDRGLFYLKKAAAIAQSRAARSRAAKRRLGSIYVNMSVAYGGRNDLKLAFAFTDKALAIAKEFNDRMLEAFANYTKGTLYVNHDNSAQAIVYFRRALETDTSDTHNVQMCCRGLAAAYHKTRQFGEAEKYYLKAIALAQKSNRIGALKELYNELTTLYTKTGNYKQALAYKQAYSHLIDSTLNAEKIYIASQLEVKYRTSEKDKELVMKQLLVNRQQAALKQKNIWIGSILGGAMLISALLFSIYTSNKRKQKLQQSYIAALQQEREIMQLKAIMQGEEKERIRIARELHDGIMVQFSSVKMNLSAILDRSADRPDTEAFQKIVYQLDAATRELRKSAHNLMPDMLLEEGLSEAIHYFCQSLQQSTGIEIELQLCPLPRINKEYELMLYRIIQELLQNAVKHSRANHILVQLNYRENLLSILVEDNGVGFDTRLLQQYKNGMGINSIRTRVHSLDGHMDINSKEGVGTTVYIEFDIHSLQQKSTEQYADNSSYNR